MRRLLDESAVLACLAYVDLNPIRAGMADSLEGYPHVSIGERLRTLDDRAVDSSDWLAPLELASQSDGQSVTVVNRLSRRELEEHLAAQQQQPLGCLPMTLEDYANLLSWLSGKPRNRAGTAPRAILALPQWPTLSGKPRNRAGTAPKVDGASILARLRLDPVEFAELVSCFSERFFTAVGCPASLDAEAKRRGRRRLNAPGKRSLKPCGGG